jgi:uncharacterized protein involved in exopolysaccharide biosynthesis
MQQSELIKIIWKWKTFILSFLVITIISGIVFTAPFFIPPVYKSEVIVYPPPSNSNKTLLERDPRFGSENDAEQQIQILKSGLVFDSVVKRFNLMAHYDVDFSSLLKQYHLSKKYNNNVVIERTRYNSISVTVYDTDPQLAADMANDIVRIGDAVKTEIFRQNSATSGIEIPSCYVVSPAVVNYKKDFPPRTLIVLLMALSSILLSIAIAVIIEKFKRLSLA